MTKLQDIANIRSGYTFRIQPDVVARGDVALLQSKDVDSSGNVAEDLPSISFDHSKIELVRHGDVVLTARGVFRAAAINLSRPAIVSSSLYVIRPNSNVLDSEFLALVLNSTQVQSYFAQNSSGSHIRTILINTIRSVPIPDIPLERQRHLVNLKKNIDRQKQLLERKIELSQQTLNRLITLTAEGNRN
jgi:restriction endonuclease S subunit